MKKIYIAGPMSGYPEFNFPAFMASETMLKEQGWQVFNPANKDLEEDVHKDESFETGDAKKLVSNGWNFRDAYLWDVTKVIESDAIFMLPGWENSPGASGEHAVAVAVRKHYPDYQIIYGV